MLTEEALCSTHFTYTGGVSVIGTATFEKRSIDVTTENAGSTGEPPVPNIKLKTMSLGDPLPTALAIKNAEVTVFNSLNEKVQCGTTDTLGNIKALDGVSDLKIPNIAGTYSIRVASRSAYTTSSDYTFVSVKQDKYRNEPHALITQFTASGAPTISVNLKARARQTDSDTIEGGAFNILNSIQTSINYIKNNTSSLDTTCLSEKLNVYWKAGFNPLQYEYPNSDPQTLGNTSYYKSLTKELYITGGQLGDVSLSNTGHYDDFAIIHELGHFIEDHCGPWVSPGGNHTLITRIDPRLAWSEGWANFLAAHVIQNNINDLDPTLQQKFSVLTENFPTNYGWTYFFNSYGFSDSVQNIGNGDGFVIDLRRPGNSPGAYQTAPYAGQEFDRVNPSAYPGEGHTREGAVSRGLFKLANACGPNCTAAPISFEDFWKSFDRSASGVAFDENPFVASDKFLEKLKINAAGTWTASNLVANASGDPTKTVTTSEALQLVSDGTYNLVDDNGTPGVPGDDIPFLAWPGYGASLNHGGSCTLRIQPRSDGALNNSASDPRYSNHFYTIDFNLLPGLSYISVQFTKNKGTNTDHDILLFKPGYFFNDDYNCMTYTNGVCTSFLPNRNSTNEDVFVMNREPASTLNSTYTKAISLSGIDPSQKYLLDLRTWSAGLNIGSNTEYSYIINSNLGVLCP